MNSQGTKKDLENALDLAASHGEITQKSKGIIIANLDATNMPNCFGAPADTLETTYPAIAHLIIDTTGSMGPHRQAVIKALNELKADLIQAANKTGAEILLAVTQFSSLYNAPKVRQVRSFEHIETIPDFTLADYDPDGGTPLYDAAFEGIKSTVTYGSLVFGAGATGRQQMVIILSDGQDNDSSKRAEEVAELLSEFANKSNFMIAFVGFGDEGYFTQIAESMGIPRANILTVDKSNQGITKALKIVSSSIGIHSARAAQGQSPSGDFFVT